jgi:hypothetical protein
MTETIQPTISCDTCIGACCRKNTLMKLTAEEAKTLRQGGTTLIDIFPAEPNTDWAKIMLGHTNPDPRIQSLIDEARTLKPGEGKYLLESDCGYLDTSVQPPQCTIYTDPKRPGICKAFQPGSRSCQKFRIERGVDRPLIPITPIQRPA